MTVRFELTQNQAYNPQYECVKNCEEAPFTNLSLVFRDNDYHVQPDQPLHKSQLLNCPIGNFLLKNYVYSIKAEGQTTTHPRSATRATGEVDYHNTFTTESQPIEVPQYIDLKIEGANAFTLDAYGNKQVIDVIEREETVHDCNGRVETMTTKTPIYQGAFLTTQALNRCEISLKTE